MHVLPTAWSRNTWSWDAGARPALVGAGGSAITVEHPFLGSLGLLASAGPDGTRPVPLFCENEQRGAAVRRGGGDALPQGRHRRPCDPRRGHRQPRSAGHQVRFWYKLTVAPGETAELRLRLRPTGAARRRQPGGGAALGSDFDRVMHQRRAEADEFYAELTPAGASADEAMVMRQAFAGMLWSKQLYIYDVARWLDGDPATPRRPAGAAGATRGGATSIPSTSCRCRTSGSTPGSPPGTWPSTA